jgi:ligand-binding sensor domain-containing protein/putative methionine-R-sulfoxide reductase with GAF domain
MLIYLWTTGVLRAQNFSENEFRRYTTASGMSHNSVTAILQDSTGYIWIATPSGLNRFNGSRFVQFHSTEDSLSLAAEEVTGMTWLDKHRLALYTAGLHIIDTKTGARRNLFIPYHRQKYLYKFNMIMKATGDVKGNIFIISRSGFYHFDKSYHLVSRFDYYGEDQVPIEHFFFGSELLQLDEGRLLIVSIGGLYVYEIAKRKIKKMEAADCPLMAEFLEYPTKGFSFFQQKAGQFFILKSATDSLVYVDLAHKRKVVSILPLTSLGSEFAWRSKITFENDTSFYITGQSSGFFKLRIDRVTGKVKLHPQKYFPSFLCTDIVKDKEGQFWIATNKGLFRQDFQKKIVQSTSLPAALPDSFPNIRLSEVYVSGEKVYVGSRGNGGLLVFDRQTLRFEKQILFDGIDKRSNQINGIAGAGPAGLMLGTNGMILLFNPLNEKVRPLVPSQWSVSGDWTNDLFRDQAGGIWIGGASNTYRYDPRSGDARIFPMHQRLLNLPVVLQEDKNGQIWMASHGLARYDPATGDVNLVIDSFPFIKMPDRQVSALVVDPDNNIWFNSNNNGLIRYDLTTRQFRHFTTGNGLPDNNVAGLIVVGNKLWIACYTGLACVDLKNFQVIKFDDEDGFPDMPLGKGTGFYYDASTQQLYVCFSNALARFNPFTILQKKPPPDLFIESLAINGKATHFLPGQSIQTSWKDNEIRISIGTINFTDGNCQRFAYRIFKDARSPWIFTANQPSFNISSLPPGNHRIQVKVYSPDNRWPEQLKEIHIDVLPPLWKKDWFAIVVGIGALALMYFFIRWRTGMIRKKEMEKTHMERLKADHYKSQYELEQISHYFSSSLAGKKTEDEVLWDVAANLIGRMNYEDCIIYGWNSDKTKMIQRAAYGPKGAPEVISSNVFEVEAGQGIVGHVMQTREPLLVNDTRKDSRYRVDDQFRLSEVTVPILHNNELLGVIDSEHSLPNYFTERDIKVLTTIATMIANKLKQIESEQTLEAKQKELLGINEQLAEARLSALQAQMNPHFVFNALNSIKRMILDGDNDKASRYLSKFALMIRMTLEHSKEIFVTLDENIEYLQAYLEMEKLRFDDSFTYRISADENLDTSDTVLPSMMIQPLVENAIWHGLMQANKDKKIWVNFSQADNKIVCTIEDNGIGIRQSEKLKEKHRPLHRSLGLENLQKRIKIMNEKYNTACSLHIMDMKETGINGSGTRVVLEFNLINA